MKNFPEVCYYYCTVTEAKLLRRGVSREEIDGENLLSELKVKEQTKETLCLNLSSERGGRN